MIVEHSNHGIDWLAWEWHTKAYNEREDQLGLQ